jgi:mRNA-degrading endonuclease toxin of MazEF toxin-antitoxin module
MIVKDFDGWDTQKKRLHYDSKTHGYYHEREIWWCTLGVNLGDEYDGKSSEYRRPVLILKGLSATTCLVVPLTSSQLRHHFRIQIGIVNGKTATAVITQLKVIDTKRLTKRICYLETSLFELVRKSAKDLL